MKQQSGGDDRDDSSGCSDCEIAQLDRRCCSHLVAGRKTRRVMYGLDSKLCVSRTVGRILVS